MSLSYTPVSIRPVMTGQITQFAIGQVRQLINLGKSSEQVQRIMGISAGDVRRAVDKDAG